jgi:F-type H+-transporting ATPase subunit gamma
MLSKAVYRFNTSQAFVQNTRRSFAVNEKQIKQRRKSV